LNDYLIFSFKSRSIPVKKGKMIKNARLLEELEREEIKKQKFSHLRALDIFESMWGEAVTFGVLPLKDYMECIETDIKVAQILNPCLRSS